MRIKFERRKLMRAQQSHQCESETRDISSILTTTPRSLTTLTKGRVLLFSDMLNLQSIFTKKHNITFVIQYR